MKFLKLKNPSSRILLIFSLLWALVLLLLGGWWLYIIFNFENILARTGQYKITKMITWEGGSFIVLLILISSTLLVLYLKDQKKTRDLQIFFASLTHELKTPLASIKLQSEVIDEKLKTSSDPIIHKLLQRLVEDTNKLETQMDKILQLSRIERGGGLNLIAIDIVNFVKIMSSKMSLPFEVKVNSSGPSLFIVGDDFALELILKNLFENTRNHTQAKQVEISITHDQDNVFFKYSDDGFFNGDLKKLGKLFYTHNSKKGSGIGLYLIKKLLSRMNANFTISSNNHLTFQIEFQKARDEHA